jgi:hypothetical protein
VYTPTRTVVQFLTCWQRTRQRWPAAVLKLTTPHTHARYPLCTVQPWHLCLSCATLASGHPIPFVFWTVTGKGAALLSAGLLLLPSPVLHTITLPAETDANSTEHAPKTLAQTSTITLYHTTRCSAAHCTTRTETKMHRASKDATLRSPRCSLCSKNIGPTTIQSHSNSNTTPFHKTYRRYIQIYFISFRK